MKQDIEGIHFLPMEDGKKRSKSPKTRPEDRVYGIVVIRGGVDGKEVLKVIKVWTRRSNIGT